MGNSEIGAALQPEDAPVKAKRKPRTVIIISAIALVIVAIAVVAGVMLKTSADKQALEEFRSGQFSKAALGCQVPVDTFQVMDDSNAIDFTRASKLDGANIDEVYCFLDKLNAPESLESKIGQTRALDGTQTASWGEFEASWTYHPDDGLNLLVERTGDPVMPESD